MSDLVNADSNSQAQPLKTKVQDIKMNDLFEGMNTFSAVEWAKRIPAFVSLSLDDQVKLLKSSWCEHCTLKLAAQNGPKAECVLLANGVSCNRDQIEDSEVCYIIENIFTRLSYWIDNMNMDKVELACLQGILLFNPGMQQIMHTHIFVQLKHTYTCVPVFSLCLPSVYSTTDAKSLSPVSKKIVGIFQEQILQSLETRTKTMYPVSPQRFSQLLLRLAPLKAISLEVMQHMEVQRALGNTKMDIFLPDFVV